MTFNLLNTNLLNAPVYGATTSTGLIHLHKFKIDIKSYKPLTSIANTVIYNDKITQNNVE